MTGIIIEQSYGLSNSKNGYANHDDLNKSFNTNHDIPIDEYSGHNYEDHDASEIHTEYGNNPYCGKAHIEACTTDKFTKNHGVIAPKPKAEETPVVSTRNNDVPKAPVKKVEPKMPANTSSGNNPKITANNNKKAPANTQDSEAKTKESKRDDSNTGLFIAGGVAAVVGIYAISSTDEKPSNENNADKIQSNKKDPYNMDDASYDPFDSME